MSAPQSVADSVLGLTQSELLLFRQQQQVLAQRSHQGGGLPDRGRGTSRQSQPSSRAASAASSQNVQGRIMLDPHSLQTLYIHLDNVQRTIQHRIQQLEDAVDQSVSSDSHRARATVQNTQAEIDRVTRILGELDVLEEKLTIFTNIRDKVKQLRNRVDAADDRLERSRPTGHTVRSRR